MKLIFLKIKQFFSNLLSFNRSTKINFVFDKDIENLLFEIGELENIKSLKHKCYSCDKLITVDNVGAIFRENDTYKFLCDDTNCLSKFMNK